ncbi:hypothetical protein H4I96_07558 [Botrytis cinerea]
MGMRMHSTLHAKPPINPEHPTRQPLGPCRRKSTDLPIHPSISANSGHPSHNTEIEPARRKVHWIFVAFPSCNRCTFPSLSCLAHIRKSHIELIGTEGLFPFDTNSHPNGLMRTFNSSAFD